MELRHLGGLYDKAANRLPDTVDRTLRDVAQYTVGVMKTEISHVWHAVDTGAMLNSVTAERKGPNTYLIGPTQSYSGYVALGTSRMAARPFHITTYNKVVPKLESLNITAELL